MLFVIMGLGEALCVFRHFCVGFKFSVCLASVTHPATALYIYHSL